MVQGKTEKTVQNREALDQDLKDLQAKEAAADAAFRFEHFETTSVASNQNLGRTFGAEAPHETMQAPAFLQRLIGETSGEKGPAAMKFVEMAKLFLAELSPEELPSREARTGASGAEQPPSN